MEPCISNKVCVCGHSVYPREIYKETLLPTYHKDIMTKIFFLVFNNGVYAQIFLA